MHALARHGYSFPSFRSPHKRIGSWLSGALDSSASRLHGSLTRRGASSSQIETGAEAVRAGAEAVVVGGGLGYLHATLPTGLDFKKAPIDAILGVVSLALSTRMHHSEAAHDLRNVGAQGLGVFAFRKSYGWAAQTRIAQGKAPGGTFGTSRIAGETYYQDAVHGDFGAEDPIVAAARSL